MARAGSDDRRARGSSADRRRSPAGEQAVEGLLARVAAGERPTALFVASLLGAIGVLAGLREAGDRRPAATCRSSPSTTTSSPTHLDPPLTTVRMPNFRMGEEAVRLLLEAIDGGEPRDQMIETRPRSSSVARPLGPIDAASTRSEPAGIAELSGKVAIVTGAGQGMGRAFAQALCEAGARSRSRRSTPLPAGGRGGAPGGRVCGAVPSGRRARAPQIEAMVDDLVARQGGSTSWSTTPASRPAGRPRTSPTRSGTASTESCCRGLFLLQPGGRAGDDRAAVGA